MLLHISCTHETGAPKEDTVYFAAILINGDDFLSVCYYFVGVLCLAALLAQFSPIKADSYVQSLLWLEGQGVILRRNEARVIIL